MASSLISTTDGPELSRAMAASISSKAQDDRVPDIPSPNFPTAETVCNWDTDDLYKWLTAIKPPPLGHRVATAEGFLNAQINGPVFLAATEQWLTEQCRLPPGISKGLCMLGEAIRENIGETSNRGQKRGLEIEGPSVADPRGKKPRLYGQDQDPDVNVQLGAFAYGQLSLLETAMHRMIESIKRITEHILALGLTAEALSDPAKETPLPFPYIGTVPKRFHLQNKASGLFTFHGRVIWKTLYNAAKNMDPRQNNRLHLHGTLGAGKSHMLAALVCQLIKDGTRVAYLPDCCELLLHEPPLLYIIPALYITFHRDPELQKELLDLSKAHLDGADLEWRLLRLCNLAAQLGKPILFIIDQANALDDGIHDRVSNDKKNDVRRLLDGISSQHMKIASSTANYAAAKYDEFRSTSESRLNFNMGLNADEMVMWWKKHEADNSIQVNTEDKKLIEEFTGRMPILLQGVSDIGQVGAAEGVDQESIGSQYGAMQPGGSSSALMELPTIDSAQLQCKKLLKLPEVVKMIGAINAYATSKINQLSANGNDSAMQSFQRGWEACIFEHALDAADCTGLDGRFFYRDEQNGGVGRSTCNIARAVGASRLREIENLPQFAEKRWLNRIAHCRDNAAVLGFLVERAVLGVLIQQGSVFEGTEFDKPLVQQKFMGRIPAQPPTNTPPVIYIPTMYNYEGVDAILAIRPKVKKTEESQAIVVGIQITIAKSHSESEAAFMGAWEAWHEMMACDKTEFRFVWVVKDLAPGWQMGWSEIPQKVITLRGRQRVVHPPYKLRYVTIMDFHNGVGEKLRAACMG